MYQLPLECVLDGLHSVAPFGGSCRLVPSGVSPVYAYCMEGGMDMSQVLGGVGTLMTFLGFVP